MNNFYLIIGDDSKLVNFYLFDILSKIDYLEDDKINYDMSINNMNDIIEEASMISLFSNKKVIIANNLDISKISDYEYEYLTKYVDNKNIDVYIIFIAKSVDGRSKIFKFFKDKFKIIDISNSNNIDNLSQYVKDRIKNNGYSIDNMNIEYLLSKLGNDINNINLELDKLFIYKIDDKRIERSDIDLLISDNIDNIIYEFTNAIYDNDYDKIVRMYNDFKIENVGIDYIVSALSNSFRQSLIVKILYNDGVSNFNIAKKIGKKEYFVKKLLERLYNYTEKDIAMFINKLAIIERDYKSGKSNIDKLELFLLYRD